MSLNRLLTELEDIPITNRTYNPKPGVERVEPRKVEPDRSPTRFNINDYHLKQGKLTATSPEQLDTKVDEFLEKTKNRLSLVYNYSSDGLTAFIVYYERSVDHLEEKYKNALSKKVDEFAKLHSKEKVSGNPKSKNGPNVLNNIQKTLNSLSEKSIKDLENYISLLIKRDKHDKKYPQK